MPVAGIIDGMFRSGLPLPFDWSRLIGFALLFFAAAGLAWRLLNRPGPVLPAPQSAPVAVARVLHEYPHDAEAYTEGLCFRAGAFIESTGLCGQSSLRRVGLDGGISQLHALARDYFGEGATCWGDKLYQLTWKAGVGFVYDANSLEQLQQFTLPGEAWGLTHSETRLIVSDGSDTLYFLDPVSYQVQRSLKVHEGDCAIGQLNELEYVRGQVLANVYGTNYIVRIDPDSGRVLGWIDLTPVIPTGHKGMGVANGIAYDRMGGRLFVTGKKWPALYEIGW